MARLTHPDETVEFVSLLAYHLSDLGFDDSAGELRAWTTLRSVASVDSLGALASICKQIIGRDGDRVPPCLRKDLERCLHLPDDTA